MTRPKTETVPPTEDGDANAEQQHAGLHTPIGSGPQTIRNGRSVEADRHVTLPDPEAGGDGRGEDERR